MSLTSQPNSDVRAKPVLWSPETPTPEVELPVSEPGIPLVITDQPKTIRPVQVRVAEPTGKPRYSPTIKEMPVDERPRERLCAYGPQALTTAELIAVLIRNGTTERSAVSLGEFLLARFGNIKGVASASIEELSDVKGMGTAKAAEIKAAIEFGNRLSLFSEDVRPTINGPRDVSNLVMPELRYIKKETLKSLLLNTKNQVLAIKTVSVGDLSSSIVHPREVFKDAVVASAASIIVAHNHPSGDPTPSSEDVSVTKRLMQAGEILGIELLDHIVVGDGTFVSLKERGLV